MKKVLFAVGVASLALTMIAGAQGYAFNTNLTVGSTGADVVSLQTVLVSAGFNIPSIASGAAAKGYFGSQTQAAVKLYQTAHGVPSTGFVGPLTRVALNGGAVSTTASTATCPAGYVCTPTTTGTPITGGSSIGGITTPGVPGIMTITAGPLSSSVLNVGAQMVPVMTIRVQAQYSDLDVQSINLDLGNNTAVYNKLFNTLYVTDGTTVLSSQPLNGSTVVQSGSEYILGINAFHFFVPKGTYKDLVIKGSLNSSIDTAYLSGGSHYPDGTHAPLNSINGQSVSGWSLGVVANGVRGVDGAGLNLYGPASGFLQSLTFNQSLVDNAQANVSLDPASPLTASVPVTDTTNNQYLGLPVMIFDVNAQNDTLHLHEVKVRFQTTGTGNITAAYLFQGSTQVQSASVTNGVADFNNIVNGTAGATIPVNTTVPFTVKADVTNVTSAAAPYSITASTSAGDVVAYNTIDGSVTQNGVAIGNAQTVSTVGPLFTLVGTPTISKSNSGSDTTGHSTTTYTATFNVQVQSVGTDVLFGLSGSSSPMFAIVPTLGTTSMSVYKDGVLDYSGSGGVANYVTNGASVVASFAQPTNTTLSSNGLSFTVSRNQQATVPVTFSFIVKDAANNAHTYAVQLQGINWGISGSQTAGPTTFMANQPSWRTASI